MGPSRTVVTLCAALAAAASAATNVAAQSLPDPADPAAQVPAAGYRSAFEGYRKMGDTPVADWREANDAVAKAGGWRAYAREAQAPDEKPGTPSQNAAPAKAAPGGHGMHHQHGKPGGGK